MDSYTKSWNNILKIRTAVLRSLETARKEIDLGHSLNALVNIYISPELLTNEVCGVILQPGHQSLESFFKELFIVSKVNLLSSNDILLEKIDNGVFVKVVRFEEK